MGVPSAAIELCHHVRHHVEFLSSLLTRAGIDNAPVYGTMDATARKLNVSKFRARKAKVLVVTDIAARGIDIPMLDNVGTFNRGSVVALRVVSIMSSHALYDVHVNWQSTMTWPAKPSCSFIVLVVWPVRVDPVAVTPS